MTITGLDQTEQPPPTPNSRRPVYLHVIDDLQHRTWLGPHREAITERVRQRAAVGLVEYGQPLLPFDGRNTGLDVEDEGVDFIKYQRKWLLELAETLPTNHPALATLEAIYADSLGIVCAVRNLRVDLAAGS